MKIKPVLRNRDVVYGNKDLKTIYTFKKFPVFMGVSKNIFIGSHYFLGGRDGTLVGDEHQLAPFPNHLHPFECAALPLKLT